MQGEKSKADSGSNKGESDDRGPGRIDEYHFFLDQDEEESEDGATKSKGNRKKKSEGGNSTDFFLPE